MSFLSKLFRSETPIEKLRKAYQQERWSEVLSLSGSFSVESAERAEVEAMTEAAANALARLNLEEGSACIRSGEIKRGLEHLELGRSLARDPDLQRAIDVALAGQDRAAESTEKAPKASAHSCSSSCCPSPAASTETVDSSDLDDATRLELILSSYPQELRSRYPQLSPTLQKAILHAHEDEHKEAFQLFALVPPAERCDLFAFEYGSLCGRCNQYPEAVAALQDALNRNPRFLLAAVTLVDLHLNNSAYDAAEELLRRILDAGVIPEYCHARFAVIARGRGQEDEAFRHAGEALQLGYSDPQLMVFVAGYLENQGRLDEAEHVLNSISTGGGCSGGANVDLAEFWLRHKRKLQQALEMFKKAAKGDPANPYWALQIASCYLALGWKKDARGILEKLAVAEMVDPQIRNRAAELLRDQG